MWKALSLLAPLVVLLPVFLDGCGRSESSPAEEAPTRYTGTIVAFGNSLTEGLGVDTDKAYPALLEGKLHAAGYPYKVINAGVSGETSSGALSRVHSVLRLDPQIVILETGANDAFRGVSPALIERNMNEIIQILKAQDITVVLSGMQMGHRLAEEYSLTFKAIYPRVAERHNVILIPFFLAAVAGIPELNQFDGIHPNAQGYKIITNTVYPYVITAIQKRTQDTH